MEAFVSEGSGGLESLPRFPARTFTYVTAQTPPRPLTIQLLVAMICLIWGSTWVVIQEGLEDLPPLTSAGVRFVVSFAALFLLAPWLHRREKGERPTPFVWLAVGTLNFGTSYAIVYFTETVLPSGLVSVLWAVFPLMMGLAGHWLLDEQLRARQWGGLLLGFVGVALLFVTDLEAFGPEAIPMALLLFASPAVSVAAGPKPRPRCCPSWACSC